MFLPQGTYTLTASLPYHLAQTSPSFDLTEATPAYNYDFSLDYLSGPSLLEYTAIAGDSVISLSWIAPPEGTYPLLGYKVYRQYADYPFEMIAQVTEAGFAQELETIGIYHYFVKAVYEAGDGAPSNTVAVAFPFVSNPDDPTPVFVNNLAPNYPNPFNPTTTIAYSTAKAGAVKLRIYNAKGQLVRTLVDEAKQAGEHHLVWNGMDNNHKPVATGLYLYRLEAPGYTKTRKMMMLK
jgi:hypothetical protein